MPFAFGRLVLITLGCFGPLRGTICASGLSPTQSDKVSNVTDNQKSPWLPASFPHGFAITEPTEARPPLYGFRRPQFELQKRDTTCLSNGTNFCFGDASSYCSSCGTCCSSSSSKWCCPSDGQCCGSTCCASGQTCSNGQCYLPVETVTSTSLVATTTTHVATKMITIVLKVVSNSVSDSVVVVTNTNEDTQTNWFYETVTAPGEAKRAEPTQMALFGGRESRLAPAGAAVSLATAAQTPAPTDEPDPAMPTLSDAAIQALVKRQQAEDTRNTMAASKSTTTVQTVVTSTNVVSSTALITTTVSTTSTSVSILTRTSTLVLNAKATTDATSTVTFTPIVAVTSTETEIATIPYIPPSTSATPTASAPPGLQTQTSNKGGATASSGLAGGAIAGVAVGATAGAFIVALLAFFFLRRHRKQKRARKTMSEEYAYFGTGRSDSMGGSGHGGGGSSPPLVQPAVQYSGPPPPMAAPGKPSMSRRVTMQSDDHGLPPTPKFSHMATRRSTRSSTSAASAASATSATSPSSPVADTSRNFLFGPEQTQQNISVARNSSHGRMSHFRAGSAVTAASSTVVGGSTRDSVQSTFGLSKTPSTSHPHKRAYSSGGASGATAETLTEKNLAESEGDASVSVSTTPPPPPSWSADRSTAVPDPPSPHLEPRGPLRIVNTPATPTMFPSIPEPDNLDIDTPIRSRDQ